VVDPFDNDIEVLLKVLDLLVGGLKPAKRLSKLPSSLNNGARLQTICGSTPGAEAHPMTFTPVSEAIL